MSDNDLTPKKHRDLTPEKRQVREDYLSKVHGHLVEESRRWGEKTYALLAAANTGGVAMILTTLNSNQELRHSGLIKCALSFFAVGVLLALNAFHHEFHGAQRKLKDWTGKTLEYYAGSCEFDDIYISNIRLSRLTWWDYFVGYIPAGFCVVGTLLGMVAFWMT